VSRAIAVVLNVGDSGVIEPGAKIFIAVSTWAIQVAIDVAAGQLSRFSPTGFVAVLSPNFIWPNRTRYAAS
jgi:hypothetical protein